MKIREGLSIMASNSKSWGFDRDTDKNIYVCMFISRKIQNPLKAI